MNTEKTEFIVLVNIYFYITEIYIKSCKFSCIQLIKVANTNKAQM